MNTDTIQVWHGNIDDDRYYKNYWRALDADERVHAEKMKNNLLRNRYVVVRGSLRNILAEILDEQPEKIRIKMAVHGKPYLADYPELVFNLSHSAGAMVIAVSWNCRLGVDIECCKSRSGMAALVDKCFGVEEIAYWGGLPESQKIPEFYRYWTRKEAFVKATGRGIALGLDGCVINPESQTAFLRVPSGYGPASDWHVLDLALGHGVCSALVTDKAIVRVSLRKWNGLLKGQ